MLCFFRLRDLESPEPSTSATQITKTSPQSQCSSNSKLASQRTSKPAFTTSSIRKDKQSTAIARQRSASDRKKETAEDAKLREAVLSEVLDIKPSESWNDIAGLAGAKQVCTDGSLRHMCALLHGSFLQCPALSRRMPHVGRFLSLLVKLGCPCNLSLASRLDNSIA